MILYNPGGTGEEIVELITRQYQNSRYVPLSIAQAEAGGLLPAGASFVEAHNSEHYRIEVYKSASLATRFPLDGASRPPWFNAEPGTFTVVYDLSTSPSSLGQVVALYIGPGGTP